MPDKMKYRIEIIAPKKLVGKRMKMSFSNNRTADLWKSFMPRRNEIQNKIGADLYSLQNYSPDFFKDFSPDTPFEKWACTEVNSTENIPNEMETFILPGGLYTVFLYKGLASEGAKAFQYILRTWLPNSEYNLDARPHFEILGEKYKNEDPGSEEEIWIPVKCK
jgi:AraC family transcriptional regulator